MNYNDKEDYVKDFNIFCHDFKSMIILTNKEKQEEVWYIQMLKYKIKLYFFIVRRQLNTKENIS